MMKFHIPALAAAAAVASVAWPASVQAQQAAVTAKSTNLRAGPDRDYPVVTRLPGGLQISVYGCLSNYAWCDVWADGARGWVRADNINYYYRNRYVPLQSYAPAIGITVLPFILNDYWGNYYRDRSWYRDSHRWADRRYPYRDAPRYEPPRYEQPQHSRPGFVPRPAPQPAPSTQGPPTGGGSGWEPPAPQPRVQRAAPAPAPAPAPARAPAPTPAPSSGPARGGGSGWTPGGAPQN